MNRAKEILNNTFGFDEFRPAQEEIIDLILHNRDVLALLPTGGGKSLGYQIPAMIKEGVTLVVSPLISLMKDQVDALKEMGVPATYINSSLSFEEMKRRMKGMKNGEYKLVYIAPERLANDYFRNSLNGLTVSQIAVDEAHCISAWGHDFRPEYRMIREVIDRLSPRPAVSAFTATATERCREDIIEQLGMKDAALVQSSFDRPNIYFSVVRKRDKKKYLLEEVDKDESTIIYCATRKNVDDVAAFLNRNDIPAGKYHGAMAADQRDREQDRFLKDKVPVMVSTLAFGMGIDKPDIRKVIHYNMPKSIENYYQEAGRAGRDGLPAEAILMFSPQDIMIQKLITGNDANPESSRKKINQMAAYCKTTDCLRQYLLEYFHEPSKPCGHCKNCDTVFSEKDVTVEAQKIISCVYRLNERFGRTMVVDVLKGSKNQRVLERGFDKVSTYGIMKDTPKEEIRRILDFLTRNGFLTVDGGEYPMLSLNRKSYAFLQSDKPLTMKYRKEESRTSAAREPAKERPALFEALRRYRTEKAERQNVPPYIIYGDAVIRSLIDIMPETKEDLLKVKGIGEKKAENYGDDLLRIVKEYREKERNKKEEAGEPNSSALESHRLYREGKTLEEIADMRDLKQSTVEDHLVVCYAGGEETDLEDFMTKEEFHCIEDVFLSRDDRLLQPVKEQLPPDYSYFQIKLVREALKKKENR